MAKIKLIALDMDGTLLDSRKQLSPENKAALEAAAAAGIQIVPTTGRLYDAIPQAVRELPFIRYAITVNGAEIYDVKNRTALAKAELSWQRATEIMAYLDGRELLYDCYMGGKAYMTEAFFDRINEFVPDPFFRELYYKLRQPVPELKTYLRETGQDVQKVIFCTNDYPLRAQLMAELAEKFPDILITFSVPFNCEINHAEGHKGGALQKLAQHLGLGMESVMAVGDSSNDLTMLQTAGLPVAMGNALDEIKAAAKYVTLSCDESGVAKAIGEFCL